MQEIQDDYPGGDSGGSPNGQPIEDTFSTAKFVVNRVPALRVGVQAGSGEEQLAADRHQEDPVSRARPGLTPRSARPSVPIALRAGVLSAFVAAALLTACGSDSTGPNTSLVGTWDLIGFTDMGVAAVTTGEWTFRADGSMSVEGTVTFPGEPTDSLVADGTWAQSGVSVTLTISGQTGTWTLTESGNEITLTENEPPPANTIRLRRHS
jgi:hypothetical protein